MAITLAVYDEAEQPSLEKLQVYLESITEFRGKFVSGYARTYHIECDPLFKGCLIRCNDESIHSDNFYVIFRHIQDENPERLTDAYLDRLRKVVGDEAQFWTTELRVTHAVSLSAPKGSSVIKMTVDPKAISSLTARSDRKGFKVIEGNKQ